MKLDSLRISKEITSHYEGVPYLLNCKTVYYLDMYNLNTNYIPLLGVDMN